MQEGAAADIRACLRFYSRLPIEPGRDGHSMPDFGRVVWATPLAGAIIGAFGSASILAAHIVHLGPFLSAACAVSVLALATGALHEDGLADVADGFGGGATRDQKLAIMRDSRLGAYGALALCLATLLRVSAIAAIIDRGAFLAAFAIISAAALSRVAGLSPLLTLLPARVDGAGSSAATPSPSAMRHASYIASAIGLTPLLAGASLTQTVVSQMAAFGAALVVGKIADRQIGGYTGDVLGAAQQLAEIAVLMSLAAS
ncbi:MAG: adenosylcobinamide-GDP ribazoletransferase [Methylocystis sp.]|nr:MAG: adenosylcobinamide-GDP ribazoletransferase [Methylocystis sp.]